MYRGTEIEYDGVVDDFYQDYFVQEQIDALVDAEPDVDDDGVYYDDDEDYRDLDF